MAKAHTIIGVKPLCSYRENARIILPQKVEEVYTWEPFIRDEARREELHNMRISIKRLRYTMEIFRAAYRLPKTYAKEVSVTYNELLRVIVDLQEVLGDIHDSDVVLEVLTDYAYQSGCETSAQGVATLIDRTKEARKADYKIFLEKWKQLSRMNFKQKLLSFLAS
ncbi:MAG: CHAD domain-containing protein [Candidatus Poribacteria bacterium]|nr:CHAD domain-containing protein [Candidatus Poribacteria bacterium]